METVTQYIAGNPVMALLAVFAGGLLSASSPCVLAIMPMVIGYVGGHSLGNRKKAIQYSLLFALGLSITFTILGAIAGIFGQLFGDVGKYWYWVVALIAIVMGLSLLGVYSISFPFAAKLQTKKRGGVGAFLLGLLFGVVSSPCATPVLVVLLSIVATHGSFVYGVTLLFVYAIGHCALIILAGIATGLVESIVQSKTAQSFSTWSKRISGGLLMLGGGYVLYTNW